MKKYIELEYVLNLIDRHLSQTCGAEHYAYNTLKKELEDAPAYIFGGWYEET